MFGCHTYDVLAASIEEIHRKYGLSGKVTAMVTDNGSNFVKAFVTFASQLSDETSSHTDDNEDDVTFANLHDLLDQDPGDDDLTQVEYELPPHQRCAAHTLN